MVKGTPELIAQRREEIVNACEKLYRTMSFKDMTLKDIGEEVPFSRPTIYNYFKTKEEIFLALHQREYDRWNEDLEEIMRSHDALRPAEIADLVARSLSKREQLLKLISMNMYDMEANSREELLKSFKASYGRSRENFGRLLEKFCPGMSHEEAEDLVYVFFPFMFGIYPYSVVTDKQRRAMTAAGVSFRYMTIYNITYNCLVGLLGK